MNLMFGLQSLTSIMSLHFWSDLLGNLRFLSFQSTSPQTLFQANLRYVDVKKKEGFRCSTWSFASGDVWHCTIKSRWSKQVRDEDKGLDTPGF